LQAFLTCPLLLLLVVCPQHLDEEASGGINEIAQQLAFSDLILLNKTDLVDKEQLAVVQAAVRRINQSAQLLECRLNSEGGQPPLSLLLENNSFSVNKALQVDPDFLQSDSGSDLEISDTESGSDSEDGSEEGGAEGGGATADTAGGNAAAGNAAAELEASTATCCEHHQHKKQRLEQQPQQQQVQQQQADSSQVTSQTAAEPCGAGAKRHACGMADESAGQCYNKVGSAHQQPTCSQQQSSCTQQRTVLATHASSCELLGCYSKYSRHCIPCMRVASPAAI
jgi:G3E family GTPase